MTRPDGDDDWIDEALRAADAGVANDPTAAGTDALAARVRLRSRRRHIERRGVTAVVLAGVVAAAWVAGTTRGRGPRVVQRMPLPTTATLPNTPSVAAPQADALAEALAWRQAADRMAAEVDLLREAERRGRAVAQARGRRRAPDPVEDVRREAERAALILLQEAQRHPADSDAANAEYRRVIDLFPETHWAAIARERVRGPAAS